LPNVRDRCLRAERAWRAMAERLMVSERDRLKRDAERTVRELPVL
jgi:hypothetical protein